MCQHSLFPFPVPIQQKNLCDLIPPLQVQPSRFRRPRSRVPVIRTNFLLSLQPLLCRHSLDDGTIRTNTHHHSTCTTLPLITEPTHNNRTECHIYSLTLESGHHAPCPPATNVIPPRDVAPHDMTRHLAAAHLPHQLQAAAAAAAAASMLQLVV
jgi:hypothetical protein